MPTLQVKNLTKDYGQHRGVFDVSFSMEKGEIFGFLGPNGAGKTVTIRHLLGFCRPKSGQALIHNLDCWNHASTIQKDIGYLPGEIAFPNDMNGTKFIKLMADMRGLKDMTKTKKLIEMFDIDTAGSLKRMSKGMKQKISIICAFMHNPNILILDEPTSGLDPLMQNTFVHLLKEEQKEGKTILMSSHIFEEIENTCDRVAMIRKGEIVATVNMDEIVKQKQKVYYLQCSTIEQYHKFCGENLNFIEKSDPYWTVKVGVLDQDINAFIALLSHYNITFLTEEKFSLENYFMDYYGGNKNV